MEEGLDGSELNKILEKYLPEKSSVLEIGMGPGKDLDILSKTYAVTGSDNSVINLGLFLPQNFPAIHPKSNIAKIMAYNGCKELRELIGKEVEVEEVGEMMWKLKGE